MAKRVTFSSNIQYFVPAFDQTGSRRGAVPKTCRHHHRSRRLMGQTTSQHQKPAADWISFQVRKSVLLAAHKTFVYSLLEYRIGHPMSRHFLPLFWHCSLCSIRLLPLRSSFRRKAFFLSPPPSSFSKIKAYCSPSILCFCFLLPVELHS